MRTLLLVLLTSVVFSAAAQNTEGYEIRDGRIGISVYVQDTLLDFGSNKLWLFIDYHSKRIKIKVDPTTFHCGVDSLDEKLENGNFRSVTFDGVLDIDRLSVQAKAPQHFEIEGDLELNGVTQQIIMMATLSDFRQGPNIECLLYIHYDMLLRDFYLDETLPNFGESACIEMLQTLKLPTERD
ncbi:MAG: hypothetical protein GC178_09490 [Flavobacteriales bacterium]|nr:hypothetical protein [Flavobacteriales bacterium]